MPSPNAQDHQADNLAGIGRSHLIQQFDVVSPRFHADLRRDDLRPLGDFFAGLFCAFGDMTTIGPAWQQSEEYECCRAWLVVSRGHPARLQNTGTEFVFVSTTLLNHEKDAYERNASVTLA